MDGTISKVFIYGVPGTGKSYLSKQIAKLLGLTYFEADAIKKDLRKTKLKKDYPFLYLGTCQAYKQFGVLNEENAIKGLKAVREIFNNHIIDFSESHINFLLEGAFIDPNEMIKYGSVFLIATIDEKIHKKFFLKHREKVLDFKNNEFKSARIIHQYLINEAEKLQIPIIYNSGSTNLLEVVSIISRK